MKAVELNAGFLGVSHSMLMQNAGREVARVISSALNVTGKRIAVICGLGGNGGDGIVAARYLDEEGAMVEVFLLGDENAISNRDTVENWDILLQLDNIPQKTLKTESAVRGCKSILNADIIVDAIMGFGLRSKLRQPLLTAVRQINKAPGVKFSIDVPSGIDSDSGKVLGAAVRADHTIALHAPKVGATKSSEFAGKLHTVSIGIPAEASKICGPGDLLVFSGPRASQSKKGDFGRILVIGGSNVFSGAPALSGMAALRTGSDLVSVAVPESVVTAVRSYSPNLMVESFGTQILNPDSIEDIMLMVDGKDAVALGPGLGLEPQTRLAVLALVESISKIGKPLVIDADGLKALGSSDLKLNPDVSVLTPHWGELAILLGKDIGKPTNEEKRKKHVLEAAKTFNSVVALKGPIDYVAHPDGQILENRTGVPAMTVGGTGDMLTGIIASLLAHGRGAFKATAAGVYISGTAGELAYTKLGDHLLATDCIEEIPYTFSL
jgi:NAD(P)H-hydrate epimerase